MDAKERHELKDNDLAEFLEHFGEFWNKRGNWILGILTVCLVVWLGLRFYNSAQATSFENAWADLAVTSTPRGYRERAKENPDIAAVPQIALLRGAEAYHDQAIQLERETDGEDTGVMSAEESLNSAESMYQEVLSSDVSPVFRANAALGLANVKETRGDFTAAGEYWSQARQIAEDARLTSIATQAQIRMDMLDELAMPIVLGEAEPQPETEPAPTPDAEAVSDSSPAGAPAATDTADTPADPAGQ